MPPKKRQFEWVGAATREDNKNTYYETLRIRQELHRDHCISTGDFVLLVSPSKENFVAQVRDFFEVKSTKKKMMVHTWLYKEADVRSVALVGPKPALACGEVMLSNHIDHNNVETIVQRCFVVCFPPSIPPPVWNRELDTVFFARYFVAITKNPKQISPLPADVYAVEIRDRFSRLKEKIRAHFKASQDFWKPFVELKNSILGFVDPWDSQPLPSPTTTTTTTTTATAISTTAHSVKPSSSSSAPVSSPALSSSAIAIAKTAAEPPAAPEKASVPEPASSNTTVEVRHFLSIPPSALQVQQVGERVKRPAEQIAETAETKSPAKLPRVDAEPSSPTQLAVSQQVEVAASIRTTDRNSEIQTAPPPTLSSSSASSNVREPLVATTVRAVSNAMTARRESGPVAVTAPPPTLSSSSASSNVREPLVATTVRAAVSNAMTARRESGPVAVTAPPPTLSSSSTSSNPSAANVQEASRPLVATTVRAAVSNAMTARRESGSVAVLSSANSTPRVDVAGLVLRRASHPPPTNIHLPPPLPLAILQVTYPKHPIADCLGINLPSSQMLPNDVPSISATDSVTHSSSSDEPQATAPSSSSSSVKSPSPESLPVPPSTSSIVPAPTKVVEPSAVSQPSSSNSSASSSDSGSNEDEEEFPSLAPVPEQETEPLILNPEVDFANRIWIPTAAPDREANEKIDTFLQKANLAVNQAMKSRLIEHYARLSIQGLVVDGAQITVCTDWPFLAMNCFFESQRDEETALRQFTEEVSSRLSIWTISEQKSAFSLHRKYEDTEGGLRFRNALKQALPNKTFKEINHYIYTFVHSAKDLEEEMTLMPDRFNRKGYWPEDKETEDGDAQSAEIIHLKEAVTFLLQCRRALDDVSFHAIAGTLLAWNAHFLTPGELVVRILRILSHAICQREGANQGQEAKEQIFLLFQEMLPAEVMKNLKYPPLQQLHIHA